MFFNKKLIRGTALLMASIMLLGGCQKINPDETLVTIEAGKDKISLGYGNFVARYTQATYDQYYRSYFGDSYWTSDMAGDGSTMIKTTKKDVLDKMKTQYLCKKHAEEYEVELTNEETAEIKKAAKAFMKDNSDEAIETMGATKEYVEDMLTYETYEKKVSDAVKEKAEVEITDDEANQSSFSYVLCDTAPTTDETGAQVEKTEEEIAEAKTTAEAIAAAEDFDAAATENSLELYSASFTTADDDDAAAESTGLDASVIAAARALEEGQVSEVIEVEDSGYYVVRTDKKFDEEATEAKRESLDEEKRQEAYDDMLKEWKASIGWVVNKKAWKKVEFDTLFDVKVEETEEP